MMYVVLADASYEGYRGVVRVFKRRHTANAFVDVCNAYEKTRPEPPPIEDSKENDKLWHRWENATSRWKKKHPAGSFGEVQYDYVVLEADYDAS